MDDDTTAFAIKDCRLVSVHFDLNTSFEPGTDIEILPRISIAHSFIDDKKTLRLLVKIEISEEDSPINLAVEMGGLFEFNNQISEPEKFTKVAEINCAAIMFPFIREAIADITRRAGLAALLLPPINLVELYKINHPQEL